jgi:hypothetical protein
MSFAPRARFGILAASVLSASALADSNEAIRQPIGSIRKALAAVVERIDAQHEMMLVSVAGSGACTNTSPNGLLDVQRLATVLNEAQ